VNPVGRVPVVESNLVHRHYSIISTRIAQGPKSLALSQYETGAPHVPLPDELIELDQRREDEGSVFAFDKGMAGNDPCNLALDPGEDLALDPDVDCVRPQRRLRSLKRHPIPFPSLEEVLSRGRCRAKSLTLDDRRC
jgi:hypothetical protein